MKNFWKQLSIILLTALGTIIFWEKFSSPEKVINVAAGDNIESQEQTNNIKQKKSSGTQETSVIQTTDAEKKKRKPVLSLLKKKKKI